MSEYVTPSTTLTHDLPVLLALPCSQLSDVEKITWNRYITSRRAVVTLSGERLRRFGQRSSTGQALWMDLALARKTGQELHNDYVITSSPDFGSLRKLFRAAVRELVHAYIDYPQPKVDMHGALSVCNRIHQDIADSPRGHRRTSPVDRAEDVPVVELPPPLTFTSSAAPLPVVQTPVRSLTPNNRSLSFLQTGTGEHVQLHVPQSRAAVSSVYSKY